MVPSSKGLTFGRCKLPPLPSIDIEEGQGITYMGPCDKPRILCQAGSNPIEILLCSGGIFGALVANQQPLEGNFNPGCFERLGVSQSTSAHNLLQPQHLLRLPAP